MNLIEANSNLTTLLIISLFNLGFFGGFSHCVGMCGPFVLTQTVNRLQNISLDNYSNFKKLQNIALLPYHLGRITTYSAIGFTCSFLTKNLINFKIFQNISAILLFAASIILFNFFLKRFFAKTELLTRYKFNTITNFWKKFIKKIRIFLVNCISRFYPTKTRKLKVKKSLLQNLFTNPVGFKGYLLGVILGFIPCGLLYGAFTLSATIPNPIFSFLGMVIFGAATFPALFASAIFGEFFFCKIIKPKLEFVANLILLINSIMLFLMALKLIS